MDWFNVFKFVDPPTTPVTSSKNYWTLVLESFEHGGIWTLVASLSALCGILLCLYLTIKVLELSSQNIKYMWQTLTSIALFVYHESKTTLFLYVIYTLFLADQPFVVELIERIQHKIRNKFIGY
jgi:hypothetical protein